MHPWNYYYSRTWSELIIAGSHWTVIFGSLTLAAQAWTGRPWLARLLFVWWMLPFVVLSFGTSKVFHYIYPFLPPVAVAAGAAADAIFHVIAEWASQAWALALSAIARVRTPLSAMSGGSLFRAFQRWHGHVVAFPVRVRRLLLAIAAAALLVSAWTALMGPVRVMVEDFLLFRNSSVARPFVAGAFLLYLSGYARATLSHLVAVAVVALILPLPAYRTQAAKLSSESGPLQTLRRCATSLGRGEAETHVYVPYPRLLNHSYYYYLRTIGPWRELERPPYAELQQRLIAPAGPGVVLLSGGDFDALLREIRENGSIDLVPDPHHVTQFERERVRHIPAGLSFPEYVVLLALGDLEPCAVAGAGRGVMEISPLLLEERRE